MTIPKLICLIPIHNEGAHLATTLKFFSEKSPVPIGHFVLCENGSTDNSLAVCNALKNEDPNKYTVLSNSKTDFGLAIRNGLAEIAKNSYDAETWIQFNGADVPFGISDVQGFLSEVQSKLQQDSPADLIIGSKFHPLSQVRRTRVRGLLSRLSYFFRRCILDLPYGDTQGTLFFRCKNVHRLSEALVTSGFAVTTEIVYWHHLQRLKVLEVPVTLNDEIRKSSVRAIPHGISYLLGLIRIKLANIRKR